MDLLLQLGADALPLPPDHGVQVPPLPPLAGDGDGDQDWVDGHGGGGREEGDTSQGGHQQGQRAGVALARLGWGGRS